MPDQRVPARNATELSKFEGITTMEAYGRPMGRPS
jgi:hypothetical protein